MVNNFNESILEIMRCNMDIKFIGTGASAKAILYYITDYITKSQLKTHIAFAALHLAVSKLGEYHAEDNEITCRAKKLLQKCAYAMISHQELSAQQVCSYLLDFEDHFASHQFANLFWIAFEKIVEHTDPSPECAEINEVFKSDRPDAANNFKHSMDSIEDEIDATSNIDVENDDGPFIRPTINKSDSLHDEDDEVHQEKWFLLFLSIDAHSITKCLYIHI